MQLTFKLRGFLKIALFLAFAAAAVSYAGYKAYKYITYKRILSATAAKRVRNFQPLPFRYTVSVAGKAGKGYLLIAPHVRFNLRCGALVIMDLAGNKLYEKEMDGAVIDFRQWHFGGHTLYSYGIDDSAALHVNLSAGHIVICDSALNEIKQVHLLPHGDITVANREDLDLHDFILLAPDHYIAMAVYRKGVSNIPSSLVPAPGVKVATALIQEVNNGAVVWQWDATRYPEFYLNSDLGNKFFDTSAAQDYVHINSIFIDPSDSNLIVSFRHQNQVVKISRRDGSILWRLGGRSSDFPLSRDQFFLRQHNVVLTDSGTLMLFDNGDKGARPFSRILEFRLDEKNKKVTHFKSFVIPAPFTESLGSVQKIGDDYLVCGGTANYVMLVNSKTGEKKMELKTNQASYRAWLVKDIDGIKATQKTAAQ